MKKSIFLKVISSGILAAMIFVFTALISIPIPSGGYANLGDCLVIISGVFLGPLYGAVAAGIGSMLSDLFLGYAVYAPVTFIIKALMAGCSAMVFFKAKKQGRYLLRIIIAALLSETIMISGYLIFESVLYGVPTALATLLGNSAQGIVGVLSATLIYPLLLKSKIFDLLNFTNKS